MAFDWPSLFAGGGFATILAGGAVGIAKLLISKRRDDHTADAAAEVVQADAAERLAGSSIKIIEAVRQHAESEISRIRRDADTQIERARRDADEARRSTNEAWAATVDAKREAMEAASFVRRVQTEIYAPRSPDVVVERLKELVGTGWPPPPIQPPQQRHGGLNGGSLH